MSWYLIHCIGQFSQVYNANEDNWECIHNFWQKHSHPLLCDGDEDDGNGPKWSTHNSVTYIMLDLMVMEMIAMGRKDFSGCPVLPSFASIASLIVLSTQQGSTLHTMCSVCIFPMFLPKNGKKIQITLTHKKILCKHAILCGTFYQLQYEIKQCNIYRL